MSDQLLASTRGSRLRRGIAALGTLVGLLVGVPAVLLSAGGDPIPDHIASLSRMAHDLTSTDTSGHLFLGFALLVAWVAWAAFALSVLLEIVGRLQSRPAIRIPGFAVPRRAAAGLFAAVAIMVGSGGIGATAFAADAPVPPAAVVVIGNPVALDGPSGISSTLVYHVQHGDTLGGIAQRFLGSFDAYHRLVAANHDLIANGPDNIQPGWTLHLPSDSRDRGPLAHATGVLSSTLTVPGASAGTPTASTTGTVSVTIGTPVLLDPTPSATAADGASTVTTIGGSTKAVGVASVDGTTNPAQLVSFGQPRPLTPTEAPRMRRPPGHRRCS